MANCSSHDLSLEMWKGNFFSRVMVIPTFKGKGEVHGTFEVSPQGLPWPHPLQGVSVFHGWDVSAYFQPKTNQDDQRSHFMAVPSTHWVFEKSKFICHLVWNAGVAVTMWVWRRVWFCVCKIDAAVLVLRVSLLIQWHNLCESTWSTHYHTSSHFFPFLSSLMIWKLPSLEEGISLILSLLWYWSTSSAWSFRDVSKEWLSYLSSVRP